MQRETRGVLSSTAWPLGRIAGIAVAIDHSWVLIFLLITFSLRSQFSQEFGSWGAVEAWSAALAASLLFFASILLHELGHSLTAQLVGVRVRSITLFIFGGLAQMESEPRRPRDEILIAAAGPLVSVALGVLFLAAAPAISGGHDPVEAGEAVVAWLGRINLILAAFNVVPGFPLDGGRVLRGIVWGLTGNFERATRIAAGCGSLFAYALIAMGAFEALFGGQIVSGLWLAFIGWFLLSAARATVGQVVIERILARVVVADAMESVRGACVLGTETVSDLVSEAVLRRGLRTLYVIDRDARLRGLVTLSEFAKSPADEHPHQRIEDIMLPADRLAVLGPRESGWAAFRRMAEHNVNQLPVVERGQLLGAVTRERLLALVQVGLAFEARQSRWPRAQ